MEYGKYIKTFRKSVNLNQKEFAEILGMSKQTVSNYETGIRHPSLKIVVKIADYFNVSVDRVIGREVSSENVIRLKKHIKDIEQSLARCINATNSL